MSELVIRDVRDVLISTSAGPDGDLVEQIKGNCGYVVRGINWILEKVGVNLLDAIFDKLGGDFATVSIIAEDWRRTGQAAGILASNYRAMADAVPDVWTGEAAEALQAKCIEFSEGMGDVSECAEMVTMAVEDMLAATKAAMEIVASTLSMVDDLCMTLAASALRMAKEIATGGATIRRILKLSREVIRTIEALADLIPALLKTAAAVSVVLKGLDFTVMAASAKNNSDVGGQADDATGHLPSFPGGGR